MCHKATDLDLPTTGVCLLTGLNGAGKSSLIEAVATALWNDPVSDRSVWPEGGGSVTVVTDTLTSTRTRSAGGRSALKWAPLGGEDPVYESAAKAQDALTARLGPQDLWAQTHVFTRRRAATFMEATDGARKLTLEALLGLTAFVPALRACRDELRGAQTAAQRKAAEVLAEVRRVSDLGVRLGRLRAMDLPPFVSPEDVLAARAELDRVTEATREDSNAGVVPASRAMRLSVERDALARLAAHDPAVCATCRRPFDGADTSHVERVQAELREKQAELDAANTELTEAYARAATAGDTRRAAKAEYERLAVARRAWEQASGMRDAITADERDLLASQANVLALQGEHAVLAHRADVLAATESVLGMGGVRAHVLSHALPVLERAATGWLARFGRPSWAFELKTYSENASGGIADALSVKLLGAPHANGYKGLSSGEAKRVDLAMLLALGELAASAQGRQPGTLWFDEALDAPLDREGANDVAEGLRDLAEDRCVVVIAFSPEVRTALRASVHYEVIAGTLTRVR